MRLEVQGLRIAYPTPRGMVRAVRNASFTLGREKLGIVGESGSGKTQTGRAILGLIPEHGQVRADKLRFDGIDLLRAGEETMRQIRGRRIAMIMQDPKYSLNPVLPVGEQIAEACRIHGNATAAEARRRALEMLDAVRIREPERVYRAYPHEVSGGMGQRVMIAMMMMPSPDIIIADEVTSALDVTVQLQVLALLDDMVSTRGMGLLFISHDLDLVASFCDRVVVMYAGQVVEVVDAGELHRAEHPYTRGLLNCRPRIDAPGGDLPVLRREPSWAADLA